MALLKMLRRHFKTCRSPLHADDTHAECVSCLGKSHKDAALSGAGCSQRGWLLSLREFQSCLSVLTDSFLFRERLRPSRPPVFFLRGTCEEKTLTQVSGCYNISILLLGVAVPHRSQSPFHQRHLLFLGMVQWGVHFRHL